MSSAIIRAYDAVVDDVNKADRTLVAKINTAGVDRYHTVIDPRGGRLENYRKNPAVLWEHGKDPRRFTDPIGRNVWIKHNGGSRPTQLLARTKFLDDDFSQQRFEWYRDGVLNAFSVNILPTLDRTSPPTREELRDSPDWEAAHTVYRDWELAEYSGTTIPGNADCLAERAGRLAELVSRGLLWLPEELRPIIERAGTHEDPNAGKNSFKKNIKEEDGKFVVTDDEGKHMGTYATREEAEKRVKQIVWFKDHEPDKRASNEGVERHVVEEDGKWYVLSEDKSKRLGGPYATKEEADKRLGQIEYFKHGGRSLPDLSGARSIVEIARTLSAERNEFKRALRDEVVGLIDLLVYGRV